MLTSVILRRSLRTTRCCVPVADRPGCRRIGPCLHIKRHYQESPYAGVLHEWFALPIAGAGAHVPLSARLRSVRTRNSADAHRTSTAERRTGRASQASPASDVCVAGSALPRVARSGVTLPARTVLSAFLSVTLRESNRKCCGNLGLFISLFAVSTK